VAKIPYLSFVIGRTTGPELAGSFGILGSVRPKSQLVLHDAALRPPSPVTEYLAELKKNTAVSAYHHIPARAPRLVDLPAATGVEADAAH